MLVPWNRLIRFVATDGQVLRGEPILPHPDFDLGQTDEKTKLQARVIIGNDIYDTTGKTRVPDEVVTVRKLLGPLERNDVDILRCVGLNYAKHTDYEGELVLIIGRDAKDVKLEDALDYVAAYTAGNDISSRKLQRDPKLAGGVPQWGFSKGFDTFAPLGPALVRPDLIGDYRELLLQTMIDGDTRQKESLSDLLFDCSYLIHYLSQGTTLRKGSVIMTGTPGGVGASLKPPRYLVPGTTMEVVISKIGTLKNGVEFA
ncbi:hypothetical protein COCMIDRAFT_29767 [Bipolaris oryzae ATCC 44560]|uniref:Fumarylacetoacetase-like C-terminal domain-containing protein n=1 Tax=Bipolaris oryzae ATCC 44560 TaxID=930090 RepID=W6YQ08_COCMI|nr:uncharacterized protein COCMIDRAFT_29767 [Bipolaris oryzae ATCC 44560]EUC41482.1 hypothetical protein COCMIDRAFT_29767 [Bipolaris oryzae ATCC 44560]